MFLSHTLTPIFFHMAHPILRIYHRMYFGCCAQAALMAGVHIAVYATMFKQKYDRMQQLSLVWTNPRFASLDARCFSLHPFFPIRHTPFFIYITDSFLARGVFSLTHPPFLPYATLPSSLHLTLFPASHTPTL